MAAPSKPNILVIMGDDLGMWNLGAYHHGMASGTFSVERAPYLAGASGGGH
jgi:arylsulfatase A-like enzyme